MMNYSQGSLAIRGGTGSGSPHDDDYSSTKEAMRRRQLYAESEEEFRGWPWWDARHWSKKVWIFVGIAVAIIIAIAVPVGVTVDRARNRYPNYVKLNYTLTETCKWPPRELIECAFTNTHGRQPPELLQQVQLLQGY